MRILLRPPWGCYDLTGNSVWIQPNLFWTVAACAGCSGGSCCGCCCCSCSSGCSCCCSCSSCTWATATAAATAATTTTTTGWTTATDCWRAARGSSDSRFCFFFLTGGRWLDILARAWTAEEGQIACGHEHQVGMAGSWGRVGNTTAVTVATRAALLTAFIRRWGWTVVDCCLCGCRGTNAAADVLRRWEGKVAGATIPEAAAPAAATARMKRRAAAAGRGAAAATGGAAAAAHTGAGGAEQAVAVAPAKRNALRKESWGVTAGQRTAAWTLVTLWRRRTKSWKGLRATDKAAMTGRAKWFNRWRWRGWHITITAGAFTFWTAWTHEWRWIGAKMQRRGWGALW